MDELERHIKRITTPIFEKFLQEAGLGSMALRRVIFRPNNYRRYTALYSNTQAKENIISALKSALFKGDKTLLEWEDKAIDKLPSYSIKNKLAFIKFNNNVTLQLGKDTIVAIYNQLDKGKKVIFEIKGETYEEVGFNIYSKAKEIAILMDKTLFDFCTRFKLRVGTSVEWERHEDFIKGEEFIDSLPKDMVLHDTVVKKVYKEGIEFKGGIGQEAGILVKNFLKNRSLDVPKIEDKLDTFEERFKQLQQTQERIIQTQISITQTQQNQAENIKFLAQELNTHVPAVAKLGTSAEKLANEVERLRKNNDLFEDI